MTLKQNKIYQTLFISLLLCLAFSTQAEASQQQLKTIELKCFVELFGGQKIIYFANVEQSFRNTFIKKLPGRIAISPLFKGKRKIYKAYECLKLSDTFHSEQARDIEKNTPH